MTRRIDGTSVAVVTGASSGIGRATALAFAERRAGLVLGARDEEALQEVARACRERGSRVVVHALDVADQALVEGLGQAAVAEFGRIDVWVNCAAVLSFGSFEAMPDAVFRQVIETNFFGYVYGARTALAQFRRQGNEGTLINIASVLGQIGEPHISAYVASKWAIRGWSACLRQEMRDAPGINICTVLPAPFDTPTYQKAANYSGKQVRSIFPTGDPRRVATAVVKLARHPRREIVVGGFGKLLVIADRVAPGVLERLIARIGPRLQFERDGAVPPGDGNLFSTSGPNQISGGWRDYWRRRIFRPK